jgi:hypothetical protein
MSHNRQVRYQYLLKHWHSLMAQLPLVRLFAFFHSADFGFTNLHLCSRFGFQIHTIGALLLRWYSTRCGRHKVVLQSSRDFGISHPSTHTGVGHGNDVLPEQRISLLHHAAT